MSNSLKQYGYYVYINISTVFLPERDQKVYNAPGRSSDLLPCLNAFPFLLIGTVAMKMFVQHIKGAYSSGNCC